MKNNQKLLSRLLISAAIFSPISPVQSQTFPGYIGSYMYPLDSYVYSPTFSTHGEALAWMQARNPLSLFGGNSVPIANSLVFYYASNNLIGSNSPGEMYADPSYFTSNNVTTAPDTTCPASGDVPPPNDNFTWNGGHYKWTNFANVTPSIYWIAARACSNNMGYAKFMMVPLLYVTTSGVKSGKNVGLCWECMGNPINVGTGNKFQVETDYVGSGELPLAFSRTYNSFATPRAAMGQQWRHSFDRKITVNVNTLASTTYATAVRSDGKSLTFTKSGANWVGDADINDRLTEQTSGGSTTGWTYYAAATDQTETYSAAGALLSIASRNGQQLTLAYNGSGQLTSIADSFNRSVSFTYNASGNIATMTDPAGGVYTYAYGTNGRLDSVTYPDTKVRTYVYNESANTGGANLPFALTGIVDENTSRFATYKYDSLQRALSTEHAGATNKFTATYTAQYSSTAAQDPLGTQRTYTFSTIQGVPRRTAYAQPCSTSGCTGTKTETRAYDTNGNVSERVYFNGTKTCYGYDTTRNLETTRVEGLASSAVCSTALTGSLTAPARRITTTWNTTFRLPYTITEPTTAGNRVTTFNRDGLGNVLSKVVTVAGQTRTWIWTYDSYGRVLTATDPRNNTTTNGYYTNDVSQGAKRGMLYSVTNAANHVTTITDYNAHGQPLSITDPNGLVTTLTYDARQRLKTRTVGGELTTYDYDGLGQLVTVTLPDNSTLSYAYDAAHRLYEITDTLGNKITYTLDNLGNRLSESYRDPSGALARTRTRVYDGLSRLYQDIGGASPATQITQFGYDDNGNQTSSLDPLGRSTTQSYDALNRLLQVIDPFNGGAAPTKYEYDAQDNLTKVTDPKNLATIYGYSGFNELLTQSSPDTGATSFTYDSAGNLQTKTDARNVTATYTYDALNRVYTISYPAFGADPAETVTYTYDSCANGKGRLCSLTDKTGTTTYAYNLLGRVTSKSQSVFRAHTDHQLRLQQCRPTQ